MFFLTLIPALVAFLLTGSLKASDVQDLHELLDYRDPLAWKYYPKSDYGYKPDLLECLHAKAPTIHKWRSYKNSCAHYPSTCKYQTNYTRSEATCEKRSKHCAELINCGYGHPESFDGRVLNPYTTSTSGFLPKACLPRGYINSKGRHYCDRKCGKEKRICYYRLNVETAETHHPVYCSEKCKRDPKCPHERCIRTDGKRTVVTTYNYMLPGPSIAVCLGDKIVVDIANQLNDFTQTYISDKAIERNVKDDMEVYKVKHEEHKARRIVEEIFLKHMHRRYHLEQSPANTLSLTSAKGAPLGDPIIVPDYSKPGEDTTCHFHGFFMADYPHGDGPHYITQYGIPFGCIYRHVFIADTVGTLLYHSHTGMQRSLGCIGRLLVRSCNDPHCKLFDYDLTKHSIMLTDFGYNRSHALDTLLVNSYACNRDPNTKHLGYVTTFVFKPNKRYRMRFTFNGITSTKLRCFVVGLRFLMTAADGHPIKTVWIDSFVLANGERIEGVYTFDKGLENYLLHCYALRNPQVYQFAVFHVKGAPPPPTCKELLAIPVPAPTPTGIEYNTDNAIPGTNGTITTSELHGLLNLHEKCREKKLEIKFIDMTISGRGIQMNGITDEMPEDAYLCQYARKGSIDESNICDAESLKSKGIDCSAANVTCRCNHIIKLQDNRCYEFVLFGSHPFHLHGHAFNVVAQGKVDNQAMTQQKFLDHDAKNLVIRNLVDPPLKDTVTVPAQGYTVIRFATTNPGFWKAHCHIELHGISGMSVTLWVQSKKDNIKEKMKYHVCEPHLNNVCTGNYVRMGRPKNEYEHVENNY